jgi:hypothetical protein
VKVRDLAMLLLMDLEKAMAMAMVPEKVKVKATLMEILSAQAGEEENLPNWFPSL